MRGVLGRDEHLRELGDRTRVGRRWGGWRQSRHAQLPTIGDGDRFLLEGGIRHQHHGPVRRGRRYLVGAHRRLGEVRERHRRVVPLGVIADHRRGVLHRVRPLHVAAPPRGVEDVADHHVDGHAIGKGVVDRHRRMLQADGAMGHDHHRLALDLGVAVCHRHRRLLVAARQELGLGVAAVVDDGLVQTAERGARVGGHILQVERLEDIDHEVRAGAIGVVFLRRRRRGAGFDGGGGLRRLCGIRR